MPKKARPWADGWEEPSARENVPVTMEQMRALADRAERDKLSSYEATRLRLGLEQLAQLESRVSDLESQNRRLTQWAKKRRGLFEELAERVKYWNERADILEIRTATTHCQDILRRAVTEHDEE